MAGRFVFNCDVTPLTSKETFLTNILLPTHNNDQSESGTPIPPLAFTHFLISSLPHYHQHITHHNTSAFHYRVHKVACMIAFFN